MTIGRPVKYKTPKEMQEAIDKYFAKCEKDKTHLTVTGLAISIDLTREGLLHYCEKTDAFADTIKKAKAKIEAYIEERLFHNNATGCIFNLKNNFNWKDKTETEHSTPPGRPFQFQNMSEAEIDARINELTKQGGKGRAPVPVGTKAPAKGKNKSK